jgi:hypothetical protein
MSAQHIHEAVAAARANLPNLPINYADTAIARGITLAAVQADLVAQMSSSPRARSKANMIAEARRQGLFDRDAGAPEASTQTAPNARDASLDSMRAEARRAGLEPIR